MKLAPNEQYANSASEVQKLLGTKININCQECPLDNIPRNKFLQGLSLLWRMCALKGKVCPNYFLKFVIDSFPT